MPELKQYYVAFLDLLGFKEMVKQDIENSEDANLAKLYKCHSQAGKVFSGDPDSSITQFSDSIVVATPYAESKFAQFVVNVARYQRLLLDEGLLCRGGIAVNKHFSNNSFTFSAGLIDAYIIESQHARYPRVVVSQEVIDLVLPGGRRLPSSLIREDDGLVFVDYIGLTSNSAPKRLSASVERLVRSLEKSSSASVREKARWLAAYSDSTLNTQLSIKRFESTRRARKKDVGSAGKKAAP
jgi:hypothetical protein